jgi:hypothetical protein
MRTLTVFSMLLLSSLASAQLSGVYSLNSGAPTGGTNFKSFTDLSSAIGSQGVSGPVTVRVAPGTYTESFQLPIPQGTSATNTITITSLVPLPGQVKLRGAATHTIEFMGGSGTSSRAAVYYVLDNLVFESASAGHAIYSDGYVNNVEIKNCRFEAAHSTRLIYLRKSYGFWNIHHNEFVAPSSGYGLYMSQIYNSEIHGNELDLNGCQRGMYFINYNDARNKVYNNWFYGSLQDRGMALNMGASNYNNLVHNNTFLVQAQGPDAVGIYTQGFSSANRENVFHDNIVMVLGGGVCFRQYPSTTTLWPFKADGNLYFAPAGAIGIDRNNQRHTTLAAWQAATGQDQNSMMGDPQLLSAAAPVDLRIRETSPAVDAAGFLPAWLTKDHDGENRLAKADIGADEVVVRSYGKSCPGTGNVAPVHASTGYWAFGTTNFSVTLSQAQPAVPALLFFAFSNTTWGPVPLPIALPGGCSALTSMDLNFGAVTDAQGEASIQLMLPNDPNLTGLSLYTQFLAIDSGATLGFTMSNGLSLNS